MDNNKYESKDGTTRLIISSINEIAEYFGHSHIHPLSISLICLGLGITNDQKDELHMKFLQIVLQNKPESLTFTLFKDELHKVVPDSVDYVDAVVLSIIKAFATNLISDLKPFADWLELDNLYEELD